MMESVLMMDTPDFRRGVLMMGISFKMKDLLFIYVLSTLLCNSHTLSRASALSSQHIMPSSSSPPSQYQPLFSSSSPYSPSYTSPPPSIQSPNSPVLHSTAALLSMNNFNVKAASRSSCVDGYATFELVTGYSYSGKTSTDVIKTMSDIMNLQDCLSHCLRAKECKSINFETGLCILLSSAANYSTPDSTSGNTNTTPSDSSTLGSEASSTQAVNMYQQGLKVSQYPVFTIYAEKICIEGQRAKGLCLGKSWTFERVIGFKLKDDLIKKKRTATSRLNCMEHCLEETSFECRSITFNRITGDCMMFDLDRQGISSGQVLKRGLFMKKKRINEWHFDQNFIPSDPEPVDFFENNCVKDPKQCEFAPIKNLILKTVDSVYENVRSFEGCRSKCINAPYRCFSFDFGADPEPKAGGICRTSHINTGSVLTIENPFAEMPGAVTYQLVSCMNVTVECLAHQMVAKIRTNRVFSGKIYSRTKPNSCMNDVHHSLDFDLNLPYNDVMCDVKQEPFNGNLFRSELVIQHHDRIVTHSDFGVSVLCRFDLKNRTITNGPLVIDGSSAYSAEGSNGLIEAANIQWPNVSMRIADFEGKPITAARVGDTLNLLFDIIDPNSPYEIFVRDLVAVDGIDSNEIVLIDSYGCPTEMAIMTSVSKFSKSSKRLRTTFEAFKFPASDTVQFRALITPCLSSCKPVQCNLMNMETGINQEFVSYGRRRRSTEADNKIPSDQQQPNPEVIVIGAIRIKDTFDFESSSDTSSSGLTKSPVSHEDVISTTESSLNVETSLKRDPALESAKCTDLIGLGLSSIVFLFGQLILLVGWYYMYQKILEFRSKADSFSSASSRISSAASSLCNSHTSSTPGLSRITKAFPSKYLFPTTFSSVSSDSSMSSCNEIPSPSCPSHKRSCRDVKDAFYRHSFQSPQSPCPAGSPHKHILFLTPDKINDFMSKKNFSHP